MWDKETWALFAQRAVTMVATKGVTQVSPHICPEGMSEPEHQHLSWSSNEEARLWEPSWPCYQIPSRLAQAITPFWPSFPQLDNDDRGWTGGSL